MAMTILNMVVSVFSGELTSNIIYADYSPVAYFKLHSKRSVPNPIGKRKPTGKVVDDFIIF